MKWFKHNSDSYTDFKIQELLSGFGAKSYGIFWICCEFVAQQGKNFRVSRKIKWKNIISRVSAIDGKELNEILDKMADLDLISKSGLDKGILAIPKMSKYGDDYTNRVRRVFGQGTDKVRTCSDNVHLEEKRGDKIRLDKKREDKNSLSSSYPQDKLNAGLRPFFGKKEMRWSQDKWWVLPGDGGKWLMFTGSEKDITWKQ